MFKPKKGKKDKKDKRLLNLLSTERYIGNKSNSAKILDKLGFDTRKNIIVIGSAGSGKCHHPWDNLKPCPCGCKERPLLMYEKDKLYYCGGTKENVFAICNICGRHTEKSDIVTTINNWNNDKTKDANMDKSPEIAFDKEEYLKHLSEDVFVIKYKERSTGRVFEINPQINNSFYDTLYRNAFRTGKYILISGELPEKWK